MPQQPPLADTEASAEPQASRPFHDLVLRGFGPNGEILDQQAVDLAIRITEDPALREQYLNRAAGITQ